MTEDSIMWTTDGTGDGASGGYTQTELIRWMRQSFLADNTDEGVLKNYLNELEVTGVATPVAVNTGAAYVYGFPYWNTASVNVAIPTLMDAEWLSRYADQFYERLMAANQSPDRVVLEFAEHPQADLETLGVDPIDLQNRLQFLSHLPLRLALDDAYSKGYVFPLAASTLGDRIWWLKFDWDFFQKHAQSAPGPLTKAIEDAMRGDHIPVIEGVQDHTYRNFLLNEVLRKQRPPEEEQTAVQLAVQGRAVKSVA